MELLRPKHRNSLWFAIAAVLLLGFTVVNAEERLRAVATPENGQDFAAYYVAARLLREGVPAIYSPDVARQFGAVWGLYPDAVWYQPYLYPPMLAQALMPLTLLPYPTARLLWLAVSVGALLGALAVVLRAAPPGQRRWIALLWLTLPYHAISLHMGQADTLVTALLATGAVAAAQRRNCSAAASAVLAAAIKATPALAAVALVKPRSRLTSLLTAGAALLTVSLLAAWAQGVMSLWPAFFASAPALADMTRDWVENLSLSGTLRRLFLDAPHPFPGLLEVSPLLSVENAVSAAHLVLAGLLLGVVLLRTGVVPPRVQAEEGRSTAADDGVWWRFALAVVWLLLAAPIVWPSTLSLLVIPATYLIRVLHATASVVRTVAACAVLGVLWMPNPVLPLLSLSDWSALRTGAVIALFVLLTVSPVPSRGVAAGEVPQDRAA